MAERKSVNKWVPPNFDPDAIPLRVPSSLDPTKSSERRPQRTVRLMLPFSLRCSTCGEYIYKGRKYNARKETCWGEDYLGIQIFRFYVRCTLCAAEITFKTDPKNADYVCENGATRNLEPWRKEAQETEALRIKRQMEEEHDPMKALENRTIDSKKEIEMAEALDELRSIKDRLEHVDKDMILKQLGREVEQERSTYTLTGITNHTPINQQELDQQVQDMLSKHKKTLTLSEPPSISTTIQSTNLISELTQSTLNNVDTKRTKLESMRSTMGIILKKK